MVLGQSNDFMIAPLQDDLISNLVSRLFVGDLLKIC